MRRPTLAIAATLLVSGCSSELPRGRHESAVINGDPDSGDPAVVALMDGGGWFCSGSLISPHVVLTAAHCIEGGAPTRIYVGQDANNPGSGMTIPVASSRAHPEYDGNDHDLGVVELAAAATMAPITRNTTPLSASMAGQDVRVVGFGLSVDDENSNEAGVKLTGLTTFDSLESDYMLVTAQGGQSGCYGDSGGPNFMMMSGVEVLAGITSFGTEDSCLAGYGGNTDVHRYAAWIDAFVTEVEGAAPGPTCAADGACASGCPQVDPDCPVDPGPDPGDDDGGDDTGGDDTGGDDDGGAVNTGGCSTGSGGHGLLLGAGILALALKRRRRA